MIDKMTTLAFSMYSNKGVYALFLGSGVSMPSGIPTGWDIVKDLTKKIAIVQNESDVTDSIEWYKKKYSSDPDYSDIIGQLANTSTERRSLLSPYFNPDENGDKEPTKAHRSIAKLIKEGYVRVILTTNFDRLLEKALSDEQVEYQVIKDVSDISGVVPLVHSNCTIVKINGDYLDCRFRNTIDELAEYPKELNEYLLDIFNNFGIITCGWSATWDKALVKLMRSSSNQRYWSVFTYLNECNRDLSELAMFKKGESLQIKDADTFFTELYELVSSLKGIDRNVPLSKEMAIERMKKYLSQGEEGLIKLNDLLVSEFDKAIEIYNSRIFSSEYPSMELYDNAVKQSNAANECIIPLSILALRWGKRMHEELLLQELKRLFDRSVRLPDSSINRITIDFNHIGSAIVFYALGTAAVKYKKYHFLDKLFHLELRNQSEISNRVFNSYIVDIYNEWLIDKSIFNSRTYFPFINHICNLSYTLYFQSMDENSYLALFCIFEKLMALYYAKLSYINNWENEIRQVPIGTLKQREMNNSSSYLRKDFDAFFNQIDLQREESEVIKQGMFNGNYSFYNEVKERVDKFIESHRYGFGF